MSFMKSSNASAPTAPPASSAPSLMVGGTSVEPGLAAPASLSPSTGVPVLRSEALFGEHRELLIQHAQDTYRLRVTAQGKLILTK